MKKYLKNLLAILFSFILLIFVFSFLELFFYLNIKYNFLPNFEKKCKSCIPMQTSSKKLISKMDLNFINKLKERKSPQYFLEHNLIKYTNETILKNSILTNTKKYYILLKTTQFCMKQ
jgi:hypothetical protein